MSFFHMLNIKLNILKNARNQTDGGLHWLSTDSIYVPTIEVIGDQQLFGSSKYIILCSA